MSQLNKSIMREIWSKLDGRYFTMPDFQVTFPATGDTIVQIVFVSAPDYVFKITRQNSIGGFATKETPGTNFKGETVRCDSMPEAIQRITPWTDNLRAELVCSQPIFDDLQSLRDELLQR